MITEDYVSYEVAKLLKEKGFSKPCYRWYDNKGDVCTKLIVPDIPPNYSSREYYLCPSQSMAMKWLREVHNIIIEPESVWDGKKWEYQLFIVTPQNADSPYYERNPYKSYEECVEAGIKYCLENLI